MKRRNDAKAYKKVWSGDMELAAALSTRPQFHFNR
jgi:hypothetical protein